MSALLHDQEVGVINEPETLSPAWIFVSYSTNDIRKVRLIRNYLERVGAEPLLFRLKFLDTRRQLLIPLIEQEIQARQFFLLCKSQNSLASEWVKWEKRYVDGLSNKEKYEIDLDRSPWGTPVSEIKKLLQRAFIVLGYAWSDRQRVRELVGQIKTKGVSDSKRPLAGVTAEENLQR